MSVLDFFFWTVWSSDSAGRRSVREHAGRQSGLRGAGVQAVTIIRRQPNGPKENQEWRRADAPLRFPAPPRMGMAGHGPLSESSRSEAEGPLSPAPWGRAGWDPAALGPAGFAKGRCPLASAHSRMSNTGFSRPPSILLFPCGFCGLPAVRPADLSCRLGDGSRSVPVRP